ncbi:hypothetical protein CCUS01_03766 [Colletotrichum cuscutae]|uniref:Uncharacterized protein n=1 Tax=Colletotrichum cuscutae TaxID=1209917 RepID=A0AAI9Y4Q5_9PEZI|nr:hypothetical protein CCUS01_03766 [Colletotrichum cuscutae]
MCHRVCHMRKTGNIPFGAPTMSAFSRSRRPSIQTTFSGASPVSGTRDGSRGVTGSFAESRLVH